jgi:hypothetical protein
MPNYGDDAIYVWWITILGLVLPALMVGLSLLKVHASKRRLDRLTQEDDSV